LLKFIGLVAFNYYGITSGTVQQLLVEYIIRYIIVE